MAEFWEVVKGVGALVGLLTGAFVVWERVLKESPLAFIIARPLLPGGMTNGAYLHIANRSPRPLLVSWRSGILNHQFGLASDHSTRAIVHSMLPGERTQVVEGNETADFVLLKPNNFSEIAPNNIIDVDVHWSFAQPILWQHPRRLNVRITKRAFLLLLNERDEWADEEDLGPDTGNQEAIRGQTNKANESRGNDTDKVHHLKPSV